ncbi:MAG: pilus assembly protein TadG-related protein [Armatimonadota bacterium]|nr:pilus assembly protein TadG-related protein [Armatimonadota bacterium]
MVKRQKGQVLAWVATLLPLLLALTGLIFDGGLLWVQYRRARWAADGAAVAAASEIDPELFRRSGKVVLGPQAVGVAQWYAWRNNPDLHLTAVYVQGNTVHVRGWVEVRPVFLSLFGVGPLRLPLIGYERPAWGATRKGQ